MTSVIAVGSARPAGNVPKGSAYGLVAIGILTGAIPFLVLQSLVPVLANGTDIWIASWLPAIGAGAIAATIAIAGLYRRRLWYIGFVFAYGWLVLAAYLCGVAAGVAVLLRLLPEKAPDLAFINVVNIIVWMLTSPLAWLLFRMLRLRYWQPWTIASEWEPPEAARANRTLLMAWLDRSR